MAWNGTESRVPCILQKTLQLALLTAIWTKFPVLLPPPLTLLPPLSDSPPTEAMINSASSYSGVRGRVGQWPAYSEFNMVFTMHEFNMVFNMEFTMHTVSLIQ